MSMFTRSLSALALMGTLVGSAAKAEDFSALMNVARQTWPEKVRIGVICDYSKNQEAVQQLALSAGTGRTLMVMDTHHASQIPLAQQRLILNKADYIVLMPGDPLVRDGSFDATLMVGRLALKGVPTLATTPIAMKQGVLFSIGEATGGELLVSPNPIGRVRVILPSKLELAKNQTGSAQILVSKI